MKVLIDGEWRTYRFEGETLLRGDGSVVDGASDEYSTVLHLLAAEVRRSLGWSAPMNRSQRRAAKRRR